MLQVHNRYRGHGGEDTTVANERRLLEDAGHAVRLFEGRNSTSAPGAAAQLAGSSWNARMARRLRREAEEFGPDVVHVHNTWFALSHAVMAAASRARLPVVATLQNYRLVCVSANLFRDGGICEDCVGRGPWPGIRHRCYRDSALASGAVAANILVHRRLRSWDRFPDAVIAVSEFGVERHVAGGVPRDRIVLKDNFVPDPGPRSAPPTASRELLFVGRDGPEKGLDLLLAGWLAAAPRDLELTVIGEIPHRPTPGVRYAGPLPPGEVSARMQRARALLVPSQWPEGQPLVLLEALAAGLPIAGSAIGGVDEVLADCAGAWRVPIGDPAGWRATIADLEDDAGLDRRGEQARALYERRFDPVRGLDNLLEAYELATERRARRHAG